MSFWEKLKPPILALAPMAGVTDSAFRQICKEQGADIVYSEMASAAALYFQPQKTLELLRFSSLERPYVAQLFGSQPEHFAAATKIVTQEINPDGLDINFGCPVKKVFKTGAGSALMLDFSLARQVLETVLQNTHLPVSLKIRIKVKEKYGLDFLKTIADLPLAAVMVHGRAYAQGMAGETDYAAIKKIKEQTPFRLLANGGVYSAEQAKIALKATNADGLGIARGAWGQPWIFQEIKNKKRLNFTEKKKIILRHAELVFSLKGERGIKEFRKHLNWYFRNFPQAKKIRKKLSQVSNLNEIKAIIQEIKI